MLETGSMLKYTEDEDQIQKFYFRLGRNLVKMGVFWLSLGL